MSAAHDERDRRIAETAARQHRLITTPQLTHIGLSEGSIQSRVQAGRLFRVVRGVYLVGVPLLDGHALRCAALLRAGPEAFLDGLTAAHTRGILPVNQTLAMVSRPGRGRKTLLRTEVEGVWGTPGSIAIRPGKAAPGEVDVVDGLRVASVPRLLTSIAGQHPGRFGAAWRQAQYKNLVDWDAMVRYAHITRRDGVDLIRAKVAEHVGEGTGTPESPAEFEMIKILLRSGVTAPLVNHAMLVGGQARRPDLYFAFALHIVEIDGWDGHKSRESFEDDRQRDADFLEAGITTQRFSARRARREPARCAELVRTELAERGRLVRLGHLKRRA